MYVCIEFYADPDPDVDYHEPTCHRVFFLNEHELWDLEEESILHWRREGDSWSPDGDYVQADNANDDVASTGTSDEQERQMYSMESMVAEGHQIDRLAGTTFSEEVMRAIDHLPADVQTSIADRYNIGRSVLIDEMKNAMSRALKENGGILDANLMAETLHRIEVRIRNEGGI